MALLVLGLALAIPALSRAQERRFQSAFEVDGFAGYGGRLYPGQDPAGATSSALGGPSFALSVAYRSPHFTHPFIDLWFLPVHANGHVVDLGPSHGGVVQVDGSIHTLALSMGPGFDVWRARLRAGFAFYNLSVKTTLQGASASSASWHFGYFLSAAGMLLQSKGFQLGLEVRYAPIRTAGVGVLAVGFTGSWDFVRWGARDPDAT
jgi:hypothetical protein